MKRETKGITEPYFLTLFSLQSKVLIYVPKEFVVSAFQIKKITTGTFGPEG
jgi:hypothetical protein